MMPLNGNHRGHFNNFPSIWNLMYARRVMCCVVSVEHRLEHGLWCNSVNGMLLFVVEVANSVNGVNIHRKWHGKRGETAQMRMRMCFVPVECMTLLRTMLCRCRCHFNELRVDPQLVVFVIFCNALYWGRCASMLKRSELLYTTSTYSKCWNDRKSS